MKELNYQLRLNSIRAYLILLKDSPNKKYKAYAMGLLKQLKIDIRESQGVVCLTDYRENRNTYTKEYNMDNLVNELHNEFNNEFDPSINIVVNL